MRTLLTALLPAPLAAIHAADRKAAQPVVTAQMTLTGKGQAKAVIALSPDASAPERNAASELATYLKQITGAEFALAALGPDRRREAAQQRARDLHAGEPRWLPHAAGLVPRLLPLPAPWHVLRDHPQWYSEINGKRVGEQAQLCMTNDAMLAEFAKNVLVKVRQQPHLGIVVVTMNDWWGNCQCVRCKAMDDAEGSSMGSLLYGVNQVAEAVEREFSEILVATHAYIHARKPPKTIRPRDNVLIWYCVIERSARPKPRWPRTRSVPGLGGDTGAVCSHHL